MQFTTTVQVNKGVIIFSFPFSHKNYTNYMVVSEVLTTQKDDVVLKSLSLRVINENWVIYPKEVAQKLPAQTYRICMAIYLGD